MRIWKCSKDAVKHEDLLQSLGWFIASLIGGVMLSALLLSVLFAIASPEQTVEQDKPDVIQEKVAESSQENPQAQQGVSLVSLALPLPPKANSPSVSKLKTKPAFNADSEEVKNLGLAMLEQQKDFPLIQIDLPNSPGESEEILKQLRICLGVRLAKVDAEGKFVAMESDLGSAASFSPYVRLVQGKLSEDEQTIANKWRDQPGSIVRLYPKYLDGRLMGSLQSVFSQRTNHSQKLITIQGQYRLIDHSLLLSHILVNSDAIEQEITVAQACRV